MSENLAIIILKISYTFLQEQFYKNTRLIFAQNLRTN